jgi:carboxymethylenebutenolidase
VKIPLQCHFANTDNWCPPEAVNKLEADLKAAGKTFEMHRYDAEHGFVNEQRNPHSHAQAELAWARMLGFLKKHIG